LLGKQAIQIQHVFTSYDNPKGNVDTEKAVRAIKEEVIWPNEFRSLEESRGVIWKWIELDYNKLYVHSKLGYRSSEEFEALFDQTVVTQAA